MASPITRDELLELLRTDPDLTIVEALGADWFADAHLPAAVNIAPSDVEALARILLPSRTSTVVVYCSRTCTEDQVVASRLERLGYGDVRVYEAGKEDWIEAGLPVERPL